MRIDFKTLLSLPVFTESGTKLGMIKNAELDIDSHHIIAYEVEPKFFGKDSYHILIHQIKAITKEKIIVEDTLIKTAESSTKLLNKQPNTSLSGVVPIENNNNN